MPTKEIGLAERAQMLSSGIAGAARRLEDVASKMREMENHIELEPAKALFRTYLQMISSEVQGLRGGHQ